MRAPPLAHAISDPREIMTGYPSFLFPFALSKQDVEEGLIHWEFGRPYLIAHDDDGYCVHLDRETYKCTAYEHRTVPCRGFGCQDNEK